MFLIRDAGSVAAKSHGSLYQATISAKAFYLQNSKKRHDEKSKKCFLRVSKLHAIASDGAPTVQAERCGGRAKSYDRLDVSKLVQVCKIQGRVVSCKSHILTNH